MKDLNIELTVAVVQGFLSEVYQEFPEEERDEIKEKLRDYTKHIVLEMWPDRITSAEVLLTIGGAFCIASNMILVTDDEDETDEETVRRLLDDLRSGSAEG